jgi:peptide/nickel transport system ATP-binding protein
MIKLQNVRSGYGTPAAFVAAIDDVSLTIYDNEILGIAGESGCGKSTLIRTLYGDFTGGLKIVSGAVTGYFRDRKTGREQECQASRFSEFWWDLISYVPQGSMSVLNPTMKIEEQIVDSLPRHTKQRSRKQLRRRIAAFLADFGLPETVLRSYPHQLSGGMRQRVLVAMAAFIEPRLILADEPTTALDVIVQKKILLMMAQIQRALENTLVLVSHDLGVHYQITNRVAILYAGKLVEVGPTLKVFSRPSHPYTEALIKALPRIGASGERVGLEGRPPNLANPPQGCRFADRCPEAQAICREVEPPLVVRESDHSVACHFR